MKTIHRLAIVILHYGDPAMTARLHDQLVESDPGYAGDVFVLDNHAPIPYPRSALRLKENLFWAGGLEYCVRLVEEQGYSHLWFLNNDILFVSPAPIIHRAWKRMVYLAKKFGPVGVYSPSFTTNPYHPHMVQTAEHGFKQVGYIDGIAPLISLDCLQAIGGVDKGDNYVGYGVDVWLSIRAAEKGWRVIVDQEVVARHRYHGSARTIRGLMERAAVLEHDYLACRLGENYRSHLRVLSGQIETIM